MSSKRGAWSSNLGFIIATAGSAIGLGNIWKFPAMVAAGGGGAFIVVYFAMIFTLGASLMLAEMIVGRKTHRNAVSAVAELAPRFSFVGWLGIIAAFLVLSYYCVVGGWVLKYITVYLRGISPSHAYFESFSASAAEPVIYGIIFLAISVAIVISGISGGIERANKLLMPSLLILLIILLVRSLSANGAHDGISFLLHFDFTKLSPKLLLSALGQAMFSLSVGLGTTCTYASYLNNKENLVKNTAIICSLDTFVAFLAAFIIIPAVFAANVPLGSGSSFAFVALPSVFESMAGGKFFGFLFYLLLAFAAITSAFSLLEAIVALTVERFKFSRRTAALCAAAIALPIGILYSLSQGALNLRGIWFTVRDGITFPPFGTMLERVCDYVLIPLGGLGFAILVGWILGRKHALFEASSGGVFKFRLSKLWFFTVRYIAPITISALMLLGFLGKITI